MQAAHAAISGGEETKSSDSSTAGGLSSSTAVAAPDQAAGAVAETQPMSYVDVMKMVQEGKTPPGVKQIPNRLTADAQELAGQETSTPPPKPWEIAADVQVSEAVEAD
jgi:hypothetical protein